MTYGLSGNIPTNPIQSRTKLATTAISGGRFVTYAGGQVATAGVVAEGVACGDAASGAYFTIDVLGETQAVSASAIAVGDEISASVNGRAKVAASTEHILGRALTATAAANQLFRLELKYGGIKA